MPDDLGSQDLAWRFLITYDGTTLGIGAVSIAEMRVGSSDPTGDMSDVTGFWYELLDGNGVVLFRRITSNPMTAHTEVSSPEGDLTRGTRDVASGEFEIVTPLLTDATTLAIFGTDPFDEAQGAPAVALAAFDLGGIV